MWFLSLDMHMNVLHKNKSEGMSKVREWAKLRGNIECCDGFLNGYCTPHHSSDCGSSCRSFPNDSKAITSSVGSGLGCSQCSDGSNIDKSWKIVLGVTIQKLFRETGGELTASVGMLPSIKGTIVKEVRLPSRGWWFWVWGLVCRYCIKP